MTTGATTAFTFGGLVAAAAVLLASLAATWLVAGRAAVRRRLEPALRRREIAKRRELREERIETSGVPFGALFEVSDLVDAIAAHGTSDATRQNLEELLDYYADVAIARARYVEVAKANDELELDNALGRTLPGSSRRAVLERRLACTRQCRDRAATLEQELVAIADVLRWVAARTVSREHLRGEPGDAVGDRIAYLDAADALPE